MIHEEKATELHCINGALLRPAMALARDGYMLRSAPTVPSVGLGDVRTNVLLSSPRGNGWVSLPGRPRARSAAQRIPRASYPDLSWDQVAASVLAGIACATAVSESKGRRPSDRSHDLDEPSWREFRARLVQKEQAAGGKDMSDAEDAGWLHSTTLIEKGSVLISRAGDNFTLDQQYFLHAVILILKRDEGGDVGVILNRPSQCTVDDLGGSKLNAFQEAELQLRKLLAGFGGLAVEEHPWQVCYGGPMHSARDVERDQPTLLCLHRCDQEGEGMDKGDEIIPGIRWVPFSRAREMVAAGIARQEEFLVLSGYCGWSRGQLQEELEAGRSWLLAAADQQALFGGRFQANTPDLGMRQWERLHEQLFDLASSVDRFDDQTARAALERWMTDLKPEQLLGSQQANLFYLLRVLACRSTTRTAVVLFFSVAMVPRLNPSLKVSSPLLRSQHITAGRLLRGSASSWILGGPPELRPAKPKSRGQPPAQYLHKAVLLVLADVTPDSPSAAMLKFKVSSTFLLVLSGCVVCFCVLSFSLPS